MNIVPEESQRTISPPRAVAISGLIFGILYIISLILMRLAVPANAADPGDWMADPVLRGWVRVSLNLIPFAGIAFLWFMAALRNRIGLYEDQVFSTVFLGSGLLFVAMLFATAAVSRGLVDTFANDNARPLQIETYQFSRGLAYSLMNTFGVRMAAVFMFVTSTIGLRTKVLARLISYIGFAGGLVLLLAITDFGWIALVFPLWGLMISAYILMTDSLADRELASKKR